MVAETVVSSGFSTKQILLFVDTNFVADFRPVSVRGHGFKFGPMLVGSVFVLFPRSIGLFFFSPSTGTQRISFLPSQLLFVTETLKSFLGFFWIPLFSTRCNDLLKIKVKIKWQNTCISLTKKTTNICMVKT